MKTPGHYQSFVDALTPTTVHNKECSHYDETIIPSKTLLSQLTLNAQNVTPALQLSLPFHEREY